MTLTEFLLARIAEDEATTEFLYGEWGSLRDAERLDRECKAKRQIVEHASECDEAPIGGWCYSCHVALCAFAAVYADHPDYREEWMT